MAIRNIVTLGEEVLRKKARPIEKLDDRILTLIQDMKDTLKATDNGIGLAAPQVGMLKRIFVIDMDGTGAKAYINPEIIKKEGEQVGTEACLSVPGKYAEVKRPARVTVRAMNEQGEMFEEEAEDLFAVCICHENDHLDGIIFVDHVKPSEVYDLAKEEDR